MLITKQTMHQTDSPIQVTMSSPDLIQENIQKLAALFPHCVTESAAGLSVDLDLLRQELNGKVVEGTKERYRLEWPGKREAIVAANLKTTRTLRPAVDESIDFDTTENVYIEGDNLEVLKLLQESYVGKIKMIYIDPPYNTGKDFVYKDNFAQDSELFRAESGLTNEYHQRLVSNPDNSGRYHSDWLSMMYPRLKLARNLLTEDGVIFISIDDNEVHNLRKICDEVFGERNFVACLAVQLNPRGRNLDTFIAKTHESILIFAMDYTEESTMSGIEKIGDMVEEYDQKDHRGAFRALGLRNRNQAFNPVTRPNLYYPLYVNPNNQKVSVIPSKEFTEEIFPITSDGIKTCWTWGKDKVHRENEKLIAYQKNKNWQIFRKDYLIDENGEMSLTLAKSMWLDKEINNDYGRKAIKELFGKSVMDFPKSTFLLKKIIRSGTSPNSIILDFFSGSATTAHAVMQLNAEDGGSRRFIMVQLPEKTPEASEAHKAGYDNICAIGKERIRRAARKIKEDTGAAIDYGFRVFRLDDSNMRDVYYAPEVFQQDQLELFADNIKPGRTALDLLVQVMLSLGLPLSVKIERKEVAGKEVLLANDGTLMACFDSGINETFIKSADLTAVERIVFRDASFSDDTAKENVKQLLKQLKPSLEMRVI